MYITRLQLKNIRCFENLTIDFDNPGSSVLILGDNGDGKTTVLRCLAMGLCDENSAAALFRELPGEFVRRKPGDKEVERGEHGEIKVDLDDEGVHYQIVTRITSLDRFERVSQDHRDKPPGAGLYKIDNGTAKPVSESDFPWDKLFVSGYGAGIRTQGTADFQHYLAVDAVYPLFSYTVPLQNPELIVRRLIGVARASSKDPKVQQKRAEKVLDTVKQLLTKILQLKVEDAIELTATGLVVRGHWGRAEFGELGDGYRTTITWILDLLAWWFLDNKPSDEEVAQGKWFDLDTSQVRGIVIIDEVEQHLHPSWQRVILRLLRDSFPKVQLVVTTHSPMCVIGTTDLRDDELNLLVLRPVGPKVELIHADLPRGKRVDQVLTSFLFGLETASDSGIKRQIARYTHLADKDRTGAEEEEFAALQDQLDETLGSGETELEQHVAAAVRQVLESRPAKAQYRPEAIDYEVRRQLRELLGDQ